MVLYKYNLGLVFFSLKLLKLPLSKYFMIKKKILNKKFSKMYELPVLSFAVSIKEIKADWFS